MTCLNSHNAVTPLQPKECLRCIQHHKNCKSGQHDGEQSCEKTASRNMGNSNRKSTSTKSNMKTRRRPNRSIDMTSEFDTNTNPKYATTANQIQQQQLMQQIEINRELREEVEREREVARKCKDELETAEKSLWSEKNLKKAAEIETNELRTHLKEIQSQNLELRSHQTAFIMKQDKSAVINQKFHDLDTDHQRQLIINKDLQAENRVLTSKIQELESIIDKKRRDQIHNESLITQYGDNLKQLELQFKHREQEQQTLRQNNIQLKETLDKEREANVNIRQFEIVLEDEKRKRQQCEKDLERARNEYYDGQATKNNESENLRRALDDFKYQNEENLRTISLKDQEIYCLQKDLTQLREMLEKSNDGQEALKMIIAELEEKNKKLNEKLNQVIYSKAAAYKERTLQALQRGDSPDRRQRIQTYGLQEKQREPEIGHSRSNSNNRPLRNSPSPNRSPDATYNIQVYKQLEKLELSNQKSPLLIKMHNIGNITPIENEEKLRVKAFDETRGTLNINELYTFSGNQSKYQGFGQCSPLRQKLNNQIFNPIQDNYQETFSPDYCGPAFQQAYNSYRNKVKGSCNKLASALGISNMPTQSHFTTGFNQINRDDCALFSQQQSDTSPLRKFSQKDKRVQYQDNNEQNEESSKVPSATVMTSSMIKKSLKDLRSKLDVMKKDKEAVESLSYQGIRCAGSKHGHDSHAPAHHEAEHAHHKYEESKKMQAKIEIPLQEDLDYQLPKKPQFNEKASMWLSSRWSVDRDDILNNDRVNKYSAYYWFQTYPILQSKLLLTLVRALFDNERQQIRSHYDGFGGVKTSENGLFLYKSTQADYALKSRFMDYVLLFSFGGWITGFSQFLILPFLYASFSLPRKYAIMQYYTIHAELLPHTEQVVFHKVAFQGKIRRIFVDIKNLEKIDATLVPSQMILEMNMFDQSMVFRDSESQEIFVFDRNGIWNEDTLKHKLIN